MLARHLAWLASGPPDVGNLTRRVLARTRDGAPDAARAYVEERGPEVSAGNGSVMYCAPLGVVHARTPEELAELAPALSALTHWDERCRTACLAVTLRGRRRSSRGAAPRTAVVAALDAVADARGRRGARVPGGGGGARPSRSTARTWGSRCSRRGSRCRSRARAGASRTACGTWCRLGGDTDTNAAVAGALLGAAHGIAAIPPAWLAALAEREALEAEAAALAALV